MIQGVYSANEEPVRLYKTSVFVQMGAAVKLAQANVWLFWRTSGKLSLLCCAK